MRMPYHVSPGLPAIPSFWYKQLVDLTITLSSSY